MNVLYLILTTTNYSLFDWIYNYLVTALTSLLTLITLVITISNTVFKPKKESESLNDKTLLMIHLTTYKEREELLLFNNFLTSINNELITSPLLEDYSSFLSYYEQNLDISMIQKDEDQRKKYLQVGKNIVLIHDLINNLKSTIINEGEIDDYYASPPFHKSLASYKKTLSSLLQSHYNSLTQEGITKLNNRIEEINTLIKNIEILLSCNILFELKNYKNDKSKKDSTIKMLIETIRTTEMHINSFQKKF